MHTSNHSILGMSWHPHVYGKPPKQPTSYLIEDILGIRDNSLNSLSSSASTTTSSKSNGMSSVTATSVSADKSHKQVIDFFYE